MRPTHRAIHAASRTASSPGPRSKSVIAQTWYAGPRRRPERRPAGPRPGPGARETTLRRLERRAASPSASSTEWPVRNGSQRCGPPIGLELCLAGDLRGRGPLLGLLLGAYPTDRTHFRRGGDGTPPLLSCGALVD